MNNDEALTFLNRDGDLMVPCSRWGRSTSECAPVALDLALIVLDANGGDLDEELLDSMMGLVVNDHDDVVDLIAEHGTPEMLERHGEVLDDIATAEAERRADEQLWAAGCG